MTREPSADAQLVADHRRTRAHGVVLIPADHPDLANALATRTGFQVATYRAERQHLFIATESGSVALTEREGALPFADVAAVLASGADTVALEALLPHLPAARKTPIRTLQGAIDAADWSWLLGIAAERYISLQDHARDLQKQVATLRRDHDALRSNALLLQRYLVAHGAPPLIQIWEVPPATPEGAASLTSWSGTLPVQSLGLCRLDLWVVHEPEAGDDVLEVHLFDRNSGETFGRWRQCGSGCGPGWRQLRLAQGLPTFGARISLTVKALHPATAWRLAASAPWLDAPRGTGGYALPVTRPGLALRIFATLPATDLVSRPAPAAECRTLSGPDFAQVQSLAPHPDTASFTLIGNDPNLGGLLVHPVPNAVTIARLPHASPRGARVLTLRVRHAHPGGEPFMFTAVVSAHDLEPSAIAPTDDPVQVAAAGERPILPPGIKRPGAWTRIGGGEIRLLRYLLDAPTAWSDHLYIATRPVNDQAGDNAWAIVEHATFDADFNAN